MAFLMKLQVCSVRTTDKKLRRHKSCTSWREISCFAKPILNMCCVFFCKRQCRNHRQPKIVSFGVKKTNYFMNDYFLVPMYTATLCSSLTNFFRKKSKFFPVNPKWLKKKAGWGQRELLSAPPAFEYLCTNVSQLLKNPKEPF